MNYPSIKDNGDFWWKNYKRSTKLIIKTENCRICGSEIVDIIDFGEIYPSDFVKDQSELTYKIPLVVSMCTKCGLVQLRYTMEADDMYRKYWYKSSLNSSMIKDLTEIVRDIENRINLYKDDVVVDIGASDGTLLNSYIQSDLIKVGFDPALNIYEHSSGICKYFINTYFTAEEYLKLLNKPAKVITSISMFYDLPSPKLFVEDIYKILDKDGIWVNQFTDLASTIETVDYSTFCTEHLEYYTLRDIINLLKPLGLRVFDVSHNNVNGGSLRIFICREENENFETNPSVKETLDREKVYLESEEGNLKTFVKKVKFNINHLHEYISSLKEEGKTIYALCASTKGNTILQVANINNNLIPVVADVNPDKFDLFTPGSNILVVPEKVALENPPDYFLLLAHTFRPFFIKKFRDYFENDVNIIVGIPKVEIIRKDTKE